MKIVVTIVAVAALASVPLWLRDPYLLNALITTGIFVIGAMSLNLLLGFTGQLSLGHIAFFGITEASLRSDVDAFDRPPPTSVHSGW